jgi:pimeloyl-ACP methyl ester carboxylesterase
VARATARRRWSSTRCAWCRKARAELATRGIELAAFTTSASADDVADVLDVLGYARARVLAHSYGTHLALDLLRRHPGRIERCALLGVAGPDDLLKPASELEPFVVELARRAAAEAEVARVLPDLVKALDAALVRARKEPFRVALHDPDSGTERELSIGSFGLQRILLFDLGDPSDLCVLPRLIHELTRGETETLAWFAAKRYAAAQRLPLAFLSLRGSSGVSAARRARIERDARASRFEDARNFPFPDVLEVLGIRPDEAFLAQVASAVPALLVSGTLDANTPVHQAEAVARTLPKSAQLVVENAGHDDLLYDARIRERVVAFLAGDEAGDERLALEPYRFAPMEGPSDAHPSLMKR